MADKQPALILVVGRHSFEVNPETDPEVQRIRREVEEHGSWQEFMKAVNNKAKN